MANVRMILRNRLDEAELSASPALVTTLPVEHLQDMTRARVARSVGLPAPQYIRGNWESFQAINAFVLWRHNLSGAATIRLRLWAGANQTGTLLYDSLTVELGEIIPYGEFVFGVDTWGGTLFSDWANGYTQLWFDQVSALSFELQIADPANADGYVQASRMFLGAYFAPGTNFSRPFRMRWADDSSQERADGGTLRTDAKEAYREFRFSLDWLTEAERASLMEQVRAAGKTRDLFLSMFPGAGGTKERDYSGVVKIVQMPEAEGNHPFNYRGELVLAEA